MIQSSGVDVYFPARQGERIQKEHGILGKGVSALKADHASNCIYPVITR